MVRIAIKNPVVIPEKIPDSKWIKSIVINTEYPGALTTVSVTMGDFYTDKDGNRIPIGEHSSFGLEDLFTAAVNNKIYATAIQAVLPAAISVAVEQGAEIELQGDISGIEKEDVADGSASDIPKP